MAVWRAYVGPDYSEQQDRMTNPRGICSKSVNDKPVAAYAWTYHGWLGSYHYIALCEIFFTLPDLEEKTELIEDQLQRGDAKYAQEAVWQKNMGQFFLHEMMHLESVGQPPVIDAYVTKDGNGIKAYGPKYVYKLAQLNFRSGGGATRASTNADTYAWLANCLYFFELTKYFPKPPNYKPRGIDTTEEELQTRTDNELQGYGSSGDLKGTEACWEHDVSISVDTADSFIEGFCRDASLSDLVLVPASEVEDGDDGKAAKVVTPGIALPGRDEKLYFEVSFVDNSCPGGHSLSVGDNDEQKVDHCKSRFQKIMNDCKAEAGLAAGGSYTEGCAEYSIRLS
ncbi:hypothetical protein ACHAPU_009790 [Fusarium lateritium]